MRQVKPNDHESTERACTVIGFKRWPFTLTPNLRGEVYWADRTQLRHTVDRLMRKLSMHSSNTLHILWANWGAGKTHALLYMRQQLLNDPNNSAHVTYCTLPKEARHFLDIYKAVVRSIPSTDLRDAFLSAQARHGYEAVRKNLSNTSPSTWKALHALGTGPEALQETAYAWLRAEPGLSYQEIGKLSLTDRIRSADDALMVFQAIVDLFILTGIGRVYLMIDEFQRISRFRGEAQDEISAGLHSIYNAAGPGLSIILSFSSKEGDTIRAFLSQELLSRADPQRLNLPHLTATESVELLRQVIDDATIEGRNVGDTRMIVDSIVGLIKSAGQPTPRRLMKACEIVYLEGVLDIEDRKIAVVDGEYAKRVLTPTIVTEIMSDMDEED